MSKAAKTPRYKIHVNGADQYELIDTLDGEVLETFEFATDAESACYLKNHTE